MKSIIIPTDFSPASTNALHYGIDMATATNASIMLFHVYQVPISYSDVPVVLVSVEDLQKSAEERIEVLKKEVEHITFGSVKVYAETRLGNMVDELESICEKVKPFAVVMGTVGTSGLESALFGSTTLSVIRHLTWPVICVPPGKTFGKGIKKIGFACDLRDVAKTTPTEVIRELVSEFNAELHVLNVEQGDNHLKPEVAEQSALLQSILQDSKPIYHFIEHRDIEKGINDFAEKNNLDLIITIPKKHKLLEGLFKHSSVKHLVNESHIPVMCVHE